MVVFIIILVILGIIFVSKGVFIVNQAHVIIIERLGKFKTVAYSGLNFMVPFVDNKRPFLMRRRYTIRMDLREQVMDFEPQPVITKDNVTMLIDTVVYYQITDPTKAMYEIANLILAIEKLTVTTLRNVIGDLTLDESLVSRTRINSSMQQILDEATDKWGVKVNRVELKNINPPEEIQEAMAKQMKAERTKRATILEAEGLKRAAILKAEGEQQAAINIATGEKEAKILRAQGEALAIKNVYDAIHEGKPTNDLITIKYLEALKEMANGKGNKLFIPYEASGILSSLGMVKELFNEHKSAKTKQDIK